MPSFRSARFAGAALCALLLIVNPAKSALAKPVKMPPGNTHTKQPTIPQTSFTRTQKTGSDFEQKYKKVHDLIAGDKKLQAQIKRSARKFGIDPIHIVGALVGEHTYNVDALDKIQTYVIKAASYFESGIKFAYDGEAVTAFVARPQFKRCAKAGDSYRLWTCREKIWDRQFSGKKMGDKSWPKNSFGKVFFQPYYAGQTFGLGQINPLAALQVDDLVSARTGRKKLSADKAGDVYEAIMEPETSLDYVAAILKLSIDAYRKSAGVDISENPGISATLYNLGNVIERAEGLGRKRKKNPKLMPEENYYGWLVNDKLDELEKLVK